MRAFTHRRLWIDLRYRLGVLGVCLVYLLAALEIPLPVFVHKISSQPFPCQDHACGCQTAEQCWSSCCCFTPEERWAWAREHNVEPPSYAEKPAEKPADQGWNSVKLRERDCGTTTEKCCCCAHKPEAPTSGSSNAPGRWVTMMTAWRCQGYSTLWTSTGTVLPVPPLALTIDDVPPVLICLPSIHANKVPSPPLDPPPRLSLV
jgi:hypothetical protein